MLCVMNTSPLSQADQTNNAGNTPHSGTLSVQYSHMYIYISSTLGRSDQQCRQHPTALRLPVLPYWEDLHHYQAVAGVERGGEGRGGEGRGGEGFIAGKFDEDFNLAVW